MKPLQIAEGIVPVGAFKAHAAQFIRQLRSEQRPIVITQNGKPAAVLVTPEEFDRMRDHERFLEAVRAGLADSDAGLLTDDGALDVELDRSFGAAPK